MPTAYTLTAGLLVFGFASAAQVLSPQSAQGVAGWLAQLCTLFVRL